MEVRGLRKEDLPAVVLVHRKAFPSTPLTLMGSEAVRRYYEWLLLGPHDVTALGVFREQECIGFAFGGTFRGAMTGFLKKNRTFLAARIASHPWLLARAPFRFRVWQGLRLLGRRPRRTGTPASTSAPRSFGVLSIAVDPASQGSGAASLLMAESEAAAIGQGFSQMHLSVHPDNARAVRFYEKVGWHRHCDGPEWEGRMRRSLGA